MSLGSCLTQNPYFKTWCGKAAGEHRPWNHSSLGFTTHLNLGTVLNFSEAQVPHLQYSTSLREGYSDEMYEESE